MPGLLERINERIDRAPSILVRVIGYFPFPGLMFLVGQVMARFPHRLALGSLRSDVLSAIFVSLTYVPLFVIYVFAYDYQNKLPSMARRYARSVSSPAGEEPVGPGDFENTVGALAVSASLLPVACLLVGVIGLGVLEPGLIPHEIALVLIAAWYLVVIYRYTGGLWAKAPDLEKLKLARNRYVAFTLLAACTPVGFGAASVLSPMGMLWIMLGTAAAVLVAWRFVRNPEWLFGLGAAAIAAMEILASEGHWEVVSVWSFAVYFGLFIGLWDGLRHLTEEQVASERHRRAMTMSIAIFVLFAPLAAFIYQTSNLFTLGMLFIGCVVLTMLVVLRMHDTGRDKYVTRIMMLRRYFSYGIPALAIAFGSQVPPLDLRMDQWVVRIGYIGMLGIAAMVVALVAPVLDDMIASGKQVSELIFIVALFLLGLVSLSIVLLVTKDQVAGVLLMVASYACIGVVIFTGYEFMRYARYREPT